MFIFSPLNTLQRAKLQKKKSFFTLPFVIFRSATRTRTGVYGVRGRCPRPLDDSTRKCPRQSGKLASAGRGIKSLLEQKSGAKVLLFFHITKFFRKKMKFCAIFLHM